jgi:hypothetical protein
MAEKKKIFQIKNILSGIVLLGTAVGVVSGGVIWYDQSINRPTIRQVAIEVFDSSHTPCVNKDNMRYDRMYSQLMRNSYMIEEFIPRKLRDRATSRWQADSAKIFIK